MRETRVRGCSFMHVDVCIDSDTTECIVVASGHLFVRLV